MSHKLPLVSIIIPCYNAEKYVAEAIESALAQTYPHCEVIVVNDGSLDASGKVIECYKNSIRYLKTDNRGACHARNVGLYVAKGERVQWLDADDVLRPNCIESKLNLVNNRHSIPVSDVAAMPGGKLAAFWNKPSFDFITALAYGSPPTPGPLHYRFDLLAIGGFREDLSCAQEYDLHLRLLANRSREFISTGQVGVDIRTHDESLSRQAGADMYYNIIRILERIEEDYALSASHIEAIAHHKVRISQQLWRLGLKDEALTTYRQTLLKLPKGIQPCYFTHFEDWLFKVMGLVAFETVRTNVSKVAKALKLPKLLTLLM
ncbi:glycosyltransferase family 2 protein [Vreelandella sulfidaeris]|uniref:glycosyltransferase family 2 protein n=1 Tax=Vreelandella sulfidaeris TaxID=115553 RepID=UPI0035EF5AA1